MKKLYTPTFLSRAIAMAIFFSLLGLNVWARPAIGNNDEQVSPIVALTERVLGEGASGHFCFTLDQTLNNGIEAFQLGEAAGDVVEIKGNTLSALSTGLNFYLNHEAHLNIAWNNLRGTLSAYPMPKDKSMHQAQGKWRYYLNYCTFSYSMAFWDEERWMREIDWMALHGVNLPLQIVGMDAVWYYMLKDEFGFSHDEASAFIAGPAFQGWWLMNNLTGHGGKNPQWWYERQARLGKLITDRMRSLGMTPCLPGYVGMAPQKYVEQTGATAYEGSWCGFASPVLLAPGQQYKNIASAYYKYINKVYGFMPQSFSIDPAHERAIPNGMNYLEACNAAREAMNLASPEALWVAQEWQINADQSRIDALPAENTLLLDLSSERLTYKNRYGNRQYLFCMLHNYGGNVGMYGCMQQMLTNYSAHLSTGVANGTNGTLLGVGATPEGIETNPMLYDLLFELPWLDKVPSAQQWLEEYTLARYGIDNAQAKQAWENLRQTVYANVSQSQQGCREPVFCARPNLQGNNASSWAGASYNWDKQKVIEAAELLLGVGEARNLNNYEYDAVDFTRQALTDYSHSLQMSMASLDYKSESFGEASEGFLSLMDDIDSLLGSIDGFRMGKWAGSARQIAISEGHPADANWLEMNARMLVTTWGNSAAATNAGGLRDYGNREWQGLISDYYKPRWQRFFNDLKTKGTCSVDWRSCYEMPYVYGKEMGQPMSDPSIDVYSSAKNTTYSQDYSRTPHGAPAALAHTMFSKYFGKLSNGKYYSPYISYDYSSQYLIHLSLKDKTDGEVLDAMNSVFERKTANSQIDYYCFDENGDGVFNEEHRTDGSLPSLDKASVKCMLKTSDGARIVVLCSFDGSVIENDPSWPTVEANNDRNNDARGQYVTSLRINDTEVYSHSSPLDLSFPADGPQIIIPSTEVPTFERGQQITIRWNATDGMRYTYLSVYFDKNANQQFENSTLANSECLGFIGTKNAQNTAVTAGEFSFKVPTDIPFGVTCLRMRFDGAWMGGNFSDCYSSFMTPTLLSGSTARGYAVKPDYSTNRVCYDIHIRIIDPDDLSAVNAATTDYAATTCFDLSGRQVQEDAKGLLIQNGKKLLRR